MQRSSRWRPLRVGMMMLTLGSPYRLNLHPVDVFPCTLLGPAAGAAAVFAPVEPVAKGSLSRHPGPGLVLPRGRRRPRVHAASCRASPGYGLCGPLRQRPAAPGHSPGSRRSRYAGRPAFDQRTPQHQQMADVVLAKQQVGRPVGLPSRLGEPARRVQLVLVAVKHVQRRVGVEPPRHLAQSVGLQNVVVVQEGDVVARSQRSGRRSSRPKCPNAC